MSDLSVIFTNIVHVCVVGVPQSSEEHEEVQEVQQEARKPITDECENSHSF